MKQELSLKTLPELDFGKVHVGLQRLLKTAVLDCLDRPTDDGVRKVILTFALKPKGEDCEAVALECHLSSKVPAYRTREFECQARKNGSLLFDDLSPTDARQETLNLDGDDE